MSLHAMAPPPAVPTTLPTDIPSELHQRSNSYNVSNAKAVKGDAIVDDKRKEKTKKIPFSEVVLITRERPYWVRKWNAWDVFHALVIITVHGMCLFAPSTFSWSTFSLAMLLFWITGNIGISVSYHRNLAHRAFKLRSKLLEYLFAYCGILSFQGDPVFWVSKHRYHHQFTDKDRDPHSPVEGFWFSHINWIFDTDYATEKAGDFKNVRDLQDQAFYRFLRITNFLHPIGIGVLLYMWGGFPFFVWGLCVRTVICLHATFLVNSVCHIWGNKAWNTKDYSKNNWFVAILSGGEGWHNNHHAFEFSARLGQDWWQFDMGWYVIKLLERIGLATDVKVPSESQKRRMALNNEEPA